MFADITVYWWLFQWCQKVIVCIVICHKLCCTTKCFYASIRISTFQLIVSCCWWELHYITALLFTHFSLVHYSDTFLPSPSPQEFIRHKLEEEQRQLEILQQQLLQEQALLMVICALFAFFVCFFKQWIMRLSFFQYTTVYYISLVNKSTQKYSLMVSRQLFSKSQLFLSIYNISAGLLIDFISWICRDLIHIFPNVFASTKSLP